MLIPSPYPSPNQVIPDFNSPLPGPAQLQLEGPNASPPVFPSNNSDHTDEWILGPWPSARNSQSNLPDFFNNQPNVMDQQQQHQQQPRMQRPNGSHHRSQSQTQVHPSQYYGGAQNPFNHSQVPQSAYMGYGALPGGMPSPRPGGGGGGGYVPSYPHSPYHQGGMLAPSPYMGHQPQHQYQPQPSYGGYPPGAGAGAMVPFQQPISSRLGRPKEEETASIDRWDAGKDYGVVLDSLNFDILKPSVVVHALLGPVPATPDAPTLVYNILFRPSRIHLSNEHPSRSWSNGRNDPATFPRMSHVRFISPHFPWTIDVRNDSGVTCGDVVTKLHDFMMMKTDRAEWDALPSDQRRRVGKTYEWNRSTDPAAPGGDLTQGVARCDFLGKRTRFGGIVKDDPYVRERLGLTSGATFVMLLAEP